jgi:hypothetical protein
MRVWCCTSRRSSSQTQRTASARADRLGRLSRLAFGVVDPSGVAAPATSPIAGRAAWNARRFHIRLKLQLDSLLLRFQMMTLVLDLPPQRFLALTDGIVGQFRTAAHLAVHQRNSCSESLRWSASPRAYLACTFSLFMPATATLLLL